jgi:hypothetical protein
LLELGRVDHRSDVRPRLEAVVDDESAHALDQRVGKTLIDRLLDDDARRGRASLSGRQIGAVEGAFDRIGKIGADSSSCAARSYAHLPRRDFRTPAPSELNLPFSECFRNTNAGSVRCLDHKGLTAGTKKDSYEAPGAGRRKPSPNPLPSGAGLKIDPEAITPTTTLTAIRSAALPR